MAAARDGLVLVDKPGGMTSHDVVARVRRVFGTRKVGHAGTLDPMATGLLVIGIGRGTRLLGHLVGLDKQYLATMRLGASTTTDDAEGDVVSRATAADVDGDALRRALAAWTGEVDQVPSAVSAVKVDGVRAYRRVRDGQSVELPPRRVRVDRLELVAERRPAPDLLDVDVVVDCSSGTYVRALARDVGADLAVGGHLVALRRTSVGPFDVADAATLPALETAPAALSLADAVRRVFPVRRLSADEAAAVGHGRPVPRLEESGPVGAFGPDGQVVALLEPRDDQLRSLVVFAPSPGKVGA